MEGLGLLHNVVSSTPLNSVYGGSRVIT
jgi:hypothetical protein